MKIGKTNLIAFLIVLLTFYGFLQTSGITFLAYLDELVEIILIIIILFYAISNRIDKENYQLLLLCIALIVIGVLGNIIFRYQTSFVLIILDVVATLKGIIYYLGFSLIFKSGKKSERIIELTYRYFMMFLWIMLPFAILNQFFDMGMSHERVFGIKGFSFFASNEGNLSLVFYPILTCLACHIAINKTLHRKTVVAIALVLILCASTLRSRALAYVLLFFFLLLEILIPKHKKRSIGIIKFGLILGIVILSGYDKLIYYFGNTNTARYNLLYYGLVTLKECFPIGAGFGTYGSSVASKYYSPLYTMYGFSNIYGLADDSSMFSNDSLWGELFGQFGFFGTLIFISIFFLMFIRMHKRASDKYEIFAVIYVFMILLIGSIGTKTFFHFVIAPSFMLLALLNNKMRKLNQKGS